MLNQQPQLKRIKIRKSTNDEHAMFGNEVQPIVPTSLTVERLQFLSIISKSLECTMYNLYLNITVQSIALL
jgi:hypothetical protein